MRHLWFKILHRKSQSTGIKRLISRIRHLVSGIRQRVSSSQLPAFRFGITDCGFRIEKETVR
ncbi:hypothetical protein D1AOALGA4SA_9360 [Olavius algarvensis Delta 1 endosymbiont]|nr:hypothetical protein D1AOALGA4SA_9360 [Olavius algarvensis Delta 1 endosymbiont]